MKQAFTTLGCPDWNLATIIRRAVEYGYDGIDFRGYLGEMSIDRHPEFSVRASDSARQIADAGLEVSCFSSSVRLCGNPTDAEEEIRRYAPLCACFHAPYIRVFAGEFSGRLAAPDAVRMAAATLRRCLPIARDHHARLLVETHDDWLDSSLMSQLMTVVSEPDAGVLWDTHHPWRMIGETPEATWSVLGDWIACTHFKDSRVVRDAKGQLSFEYCLTGEGDIPFERILRTLAHGGYDGWLTYEWEKVWHPGIPEPEIAFPVHAKAMRRFLQKLAA